MTHRVVASSNRGAFATGDGHGGAPGCNLRGRGEEAAGAGAAERGKLLEAPDAPKSQPQGEGFGGDEVPVDIKVDVR